MENKNIVFHETIENIFEYPEILDNKFFFNYEILIYFDGNIKIIKEVINRNNNEERTKKILLDISPKEIYPIIIDYYSDILHNLNTNLPSKYIEDELLHIKNILDIDNRFLNYINIRFNTLIRKNSYYKMENENLKIMNNRYRLEIMDYKK